MRNKDYYLRLAKKYFDAELSEIEDIRLRHFLSTTDDARFDDVKAVMGYLSIKKRRHAAKSPKAPATKLYLASTLAAACIIIGLMPMLRPDVCVHKTNGVVTSNEILVMEAVEGVLSDFFSSDDDIDSILNDILNNGEI